MVIIGLLAIAAGLLAGISPAFRGVLGQLAAGSWDHAADIAFRTYRFFRRTTIITVACSFMALNVMFHFGIMNSMWILLGITALIFFLFGEIELLRMWLLLGIATVIWLLSLLTGHYGHETAAGVLSTIAILGSLFMAMFASSVHEAMIDDDDEGGIFARVMNLGAGFASAAAIVFAAWMALMASATLLYYMQHTDDIYQLPLRLLFVLVLGSLLGYAARLFQHKAMTAVAWVGYIALILIFIAPIGQYAPGPMQGEARYISNRLYSVETAHVQRMAATGRVYYTLPQATRAWVCDKCEVVVSNKHYPTVGDSIAVRKIGTTIKLDAAKRFVSYRWKPIEINGVMFVAVHPEFPDADFGYDMNTTYLINTRYLKETSVEPDRGSLQSQQAANVQVSAPVAPVSYRQPRTAPAVRSAPRAVLLDVSIPSTSEEWIEVGEVKAGATIEAAGCIVWDSTQQCVGPNGGYQVSRLGSPSDFPDPAGNAGSLVGKLNGKVFQIGRFHTISEGGILYAKVNDRPGASLQDNDGSFRVRIY